MDQRPATASRTLLQRKAGGCVCGGSCPRCQAKSALKIGAPDDACEREADTLADRVMRVADGTGPVTPVASAVQRTCSACEKEREQRLLQPTAEPSSAATTATAPASVDAVMRSPGQTLDSDTRAFFEPRFGRDLGGVQVHVDSAAQQSARDASAHAYTVGRDIVFGRGQFAPATFEGRRLLAHELVHVLQQGGDAAGSSGAGRSVQRSAVEVPASGGETGELPSLEEDTLPYGPTSSTIAPEVCPPPEMQCAAAPDIPAASHEFIFPVDSALLNAVQRAEIDGVAAAWHAGGGIGDLRIDGYASAEGACNYNWDLSCRRARAVRDELAAPSDGTPGVAISDLFAHGESNAAGSTLPVNRRATIAIRTPPPPTPAPTPAPPPCPLPVSLGHGRGAGSGDDFAHFDSPTISASSEALLAAWARSHPPFGMRPFRSLITDIECEAEMDAVLLGLAGLEGHAAFTHFAGGSGSMVTHAAGGLLGAGSTLGSLALASGSFTATVAAVKTDIESQLAAQASSGTLNPCALSVTPPQTHFGVSDGMPLKAVIGGTQEEEIFCTGFTGSPSLRTYSIDLRFDIRDDFGVDESDLYAPGLFAFWVLQHERSATAYAPFINQLDLSVNVSGTF
jgi:outer membrane protein OmpA-like peptidoglycan-associated protein